MKTSIISALLLVTTTGIYAATAPSTAIPAATVKPTNATTLTGDPSKQIETLNQKLQAQLTQIQSQTQQQLQTMNAQIQTQMKQIQAQCQSQTADLNQQIQTQLKTLQAGLEAQIQQLHGEIGQIKK